MSVKLDGNGYEDVLRAIEQDCKKVDPLQNIKGPSAYKAQAEISGEAMLLFKHYGLESEAETFTINLPCPDPPVRMGPPFLKKEKRKKKAVTGAGGGEARASGATGGASFLEERRAERGGEAEERGSLSRIGNSEKAGSGGGHGRWGQGPLADPRGAGFPFLFVGRR
jgi:hypothetical protein